jgi:hypothetical protein
MLEAIMEVCFIYFLLKEMGVDVKLPIVVRCDNVSAIFMAENSSSGIRTHHIDARYHYADMFMKNVGKEAYEKHVNTFLGKTQDLNLEYRGKEVYWYESPMFSG